MRRGPAPSVANGQTLVELLRGLEDGGERPAIVSFDADGQRATSYRTLAAEVRPLAGGLQADGIEPGTFVGFFAPNSAAWITARLAVLMAGGVAVSLDSDLTEDQLRQQLADCEAPRIFTVSHHLPSLERAAPHRPKVWLLDVQEDDPRCYRHLFSAPLDSLPEVSPGDTTALFYTSGTTGPPKGVPLTHRNIVSNVKALLALDLVGAGDRVLLPLPLHHSYPFIVGMTMPLVSRAAIVLPRDVSGPEVRRALSEGEVAIVVGVPRLYEALADGLSKRLREGGAVEKGLFGVLLLSGFLRRRLGLLWGRTLLKPLHKRLAPKLRLLASGGAKLDAAAGHRLEAFGWMVLSGYGLVETASISTFNPPGKARMDSAGLPAPGVNIRIAEPNAEGHGEVQIKGPNVFSGYRNRPDANAESFTEDGWFRSGDLGVTDADGYLYIVGRAKEMIVLPDGKNIAPEEVEAVYGESPYIHEMAVLERSGRLTGLVVPDFDAIRGAGARIDDLIRVALAEAAPNLPPYKRLGDWAITRETLPRTRLGKYQRHKLPAILERAEKGQVPEAGELSDADSTLLENPRARRVFEWLEQRFPDRRLTPDTSPQLDLGIDSLAWVQLGVEIEERFGIALSEEAVSRCLTVRDLLNEVAAAPAAEADTSRQDAMIAEAERWLQPKGPGARTAASALHLLARGLCKATFRLRVEGRDTLPDHGPLIIAPNHTSDLDPLVLAAALPAGLLDSLAWGADRDRVFGNRFLRLFARPAGLFPVDDRAPSAALATAAKALSGDRILIWFPEEWRSPDGRLQRFFPGIGHILQESGARIVPCHIAGTFEAMPRRARWPKPHPVRVRFGPPVAYEQLRQEAGSSEAVALAEAVRAQVAALGDYDGPATTT